MSSDVRGASFSNPMHGIYCCDKNFGQHLPDASEAGDDDLPEPRRQFAIVPVRRLRAQPQFPLVADGASELAKHRRDEQAKADRQPDELADCRVG
jgi:hypothetical protein